MSAEKPKRDRRAFLGDALRVAGALGIGGTIAGFISRC